MADIPTRSIDDEISYQIEKAKFELRQQLQEQNEGELRDLKDNYAIAQSRFQWWTTGFGAMAIAVVAFWAQDRISENVTDAKSELLLAVEAQSDAASQTIQDTLTARIDSRLSRERDVLEGRMLQERTLSTLLPLVVGEAIDFEDDRGGNRSSVPLILEALAEVGPQISELEGYSLELALRRIERILDTFDAVGDYHNVHRAFETLPPELQQKMLAHDGILQTLSMALTQEVLEKNVVPNNRTEIVAQVLQQSPDPERFAFDRVGLLGLVVSGVNSDWEEAGLAQAALIQMSRDEEKFVAINMVQLCFLHDIWSASANNPNGQAHLRARVIARHIGVNLNDGVCN